MIIRFTPQADIELAEARKWYAHQREDLDFEFMKGIATRTSVWLRLTTARSR